MNIKKVIIWGYKSNVNTFHYIHFGFFRAFEHLGYDVHWLDDNSDISGFDFSECLFITANDQEKKIIIRKDCYYVLHNVDTQKYILSDCKYIVLQVHTIDSLKNINSDDIIFNKYSLFKKDINCLYAAWATDMLPNEIDINNARNIVDNKYCFWAGTYGGGSSVFQNESELNPFFNKCISNGIVVNKIDPWSNPISFEDNRILVNKSYISPSIQGPWQIDNKYIPCRIFKNISYGHYGYTNSLTVNDIFDGALVYDRDPIELFNKIIEKKNDPNHISDLKYLMNEVKEKHTYVSRANLIIECIK